MSVGQFLGILWARRHVVVISTFLCGLLAAVVVQLLPPKYEAKSRVMLDVIKPDPVTGQVMATAFLRAYVKTQIELLQDYHVARAVVDDLKWANNPKLMREYRNRNSGDDRDFNRWAAQKVIDGTKADVIEGSNILEISYDSPEPETAKLVADGLQKAYIDTTLQTRREAARRNADWYEVQADKAKASLFQAESAKSEFEKQSGILLEDNKTDLDSARLASLAGAGLAPVVTAPAAGPTPAEIQLSQLDADIAQASKTLGPNHPQLIEMRRRREMLAKMASDQRATAGASAAATAGAARAAVGLLEQQKAKVMSQRSNVEKLRILADDVERKREEYNKSAARAAELRQESEVAESGVTPLGAAVTPQSPVFPNKPLLIGAGFGGGLGLGFVIALALELFGRRIRSHQDLQVAVHVPVLAIVAKPRTRTGLHLRSRLWRMLLRSRGHRAKAA
jgi:uncharacterized protein involved in exopolysaccharide biosynthesis